MPYLIGAVLALAVSLGARRITLDRDRAFYPVMLAVVASYYVLFAVMGGSLATVLVEIAIMIVFLAVMSLGFRANLWWIVGGLAGHGLLDAVHGRIVTNTGMPVWWPEFCGTYDITAAIALAAILAMPKGIRAGVAMIGSNSRKGLGIAAGLLVMLAAGGQSAVAQDAPRNSVSLSALQTRPVGALGDNIGNGYGVTGAFMVPLDPKGLLSVRADLAFAQYGDDARRTAFSESVGDRVEVRVRTTNAVVPGSIGLQLTVPSGPVRPYAHAGIGAQVFYTESGVEPTNGGTALASTVNQSGVAMTWAMGGGLYVPLNIGAGKVSLDVGAQYIAGGEAKYLAPGSITDLPGGHISVATIRSSTHMIAVHVGARIGL